MMIQKKKVIGYSHEEKETKEHPKELKSTETEYKRTYDSRTSPNQTIRIDYTYIWSRLKKKYNDLSVEYTEWKKIDTYERVTRLPPVLLNVDRQTLVIKDWTPRFIMEVYYRDIFYYNNGSVIYGNWTLQSYLSL